MRIPGLLIRIPPPMNVMPFTMAADVPICLGFITSAAVLNASLLQALAKPSVKHRRMARPGFVMALFALYHAERPLRSIVAW